MKSRIMSEEEYYKMLKNSKNKEEFAENIKKFLDEKEETKTKVEKKPEVEPLIDEEEPKENNKKKIKKVKKNNDKIKKAAITTAIGTAIIILGMYLYKINIKDKDVTETIFEPIDNNPGYETTVDETEDVVETETEVETINEEAELDVNSDEFIRSVANNVINQINEIRVNDPKFAISMDDTYIYELVKYVHHDEANYKGTYSITNENAYGNFNELSKNPRFNIGSLFEGLEYESYLTNMSNALANVREENGYDDEYTAFQAIGAAVDNIDTNKYPEVFATRALLDNYMWLTSMQIASNKNLEGIEKEVYGDEQASISENVRYDCKKVWDSVDRNSSSYVLYDAIEEGFNEDEHINEYNAKAEVQNTIDYSAVDDSYEDVAEELYNHILENKNKYGNDFAYQFGSKEDVLQLIYFVNQFKDPNARSMITDIEVFENLVNSYYQSCARYGVTPELSKVFASYQYAEDVLGEAEKLAANLKNGNGKDYTIANDYYRYYYYTLCAPERVNPSVKENAPLVVMLIDQFKNYRMTGNMLEAREYQKTYDLGVGIDGQAMCPDAVDDMIIYQTPSQGGHVYGDNPFTQVYENIELECQRRSK